MPTATNVRRWMRVVVLVIGLLAIYRWQTAFLAPTATIPHGYKVTASTGINREKDFVFFLYHLNLFPIGADTVFRADTADEARRILREEPQKLKQDQDATFRSGDRGRTYLYLVDCWLKHSAMNPSLHPAHALAFITALCALFVAFWWIGKTAWGAVLCVFIGSNPWQLFAVYKHENVFSWSITLMTALLAVNIPVMWPRRPKWYPLAAAIASGLLVALVRTVRSEPMPMVLSAMFVAGTCAGLAWKRRAILAGVVLGTFMFASWGSLAFLNHKLRQSMAVVAEAGGSPYAAPIISYHEVWHPIFCGLGDFDTKYGYVWEDTVAYKYAYPELQRMNPTMALNPKTPWQSWSWDKQGKYPYFYPEAPGYHDIIRRKVVGDIERDPLWYLDILRQRAWRILTQTTPIGFTRANGDDYQVGGAWLGVLCVPLAVFLAWSRRWFLLKLLLFSLPLSIAPFIIYSDRGMCFYSMYHVFGAFILGLLAWEGGKQWLRARHVTEAPSPTPP